MPRRDATGPFGTGPVGRGRGPRGGGGANRGRGIGFGRGGRFGNGRMPAEPLPADEKELLDEQKSWLERQLAAIAKRLEDLGK